MKTPGKKSARRDHLLNHIVNVPQEPQEPQDESQPLSQTTPPPPPAPRIEFVSFNTRLTVKNDIALHGICYWGRMTKQEFVNNALTEYMSKPEFKEFNRPKPPKS